MCQCLDGRFFATARTALGNLGEAFLNEVIACTLPDLNPLACADTQPGIGKVSWCLDCCFHLIKTCEASVSEKEWG